MRPTGLYIHIPYCTTKCGYCDFYSVPLSGKSPARLINALVRELGQRGGQGNGGFKTVFVGGGTPTVLPVPELRRLLGVLAGVTARGTTEEFTIEANPATLDDEKIAVLRSAGVDRISLGAQSFDRAELAVLERLHDPDDIARSVATARRGGFRRINLDLIFGIPGQSMESWLESLRRACALPIDHVSCYGLTYEPGTALTGRLERGDLTRCDENLEADMYVACQEVLAAKGFEQYEISNFARQGSWCLHNLVYWHNESYLGVGPSAASYVDGWRSRNVPDVLRYIEMIERTGEATVEREHLTGKALAGETAILQLRMNEGIDIEAFNKKVGLNPVKLYELQFARFQSAGLLEVTPDHVRLTNRGRLVADTVLAELVFTREETESEPRP